MPKRVSVSTPFWPVVRSCVSVHGRIILGAFTINLSRKSYAPSDLVRVFDATWAIIRPKDRRMRTRQETRLRLDLAKCIISLAENGVTDPIELRRRAIEQMILEP